MKNALLALYVFLLLIITPFTFSGQVYLDLIKEVKFSTEPRDIILNENAYIITAGSVYSVSITDPYNLNNTEIKAVSGAKSIAFIGHYAYVLYPGANIVVYDFSKSPVQKKTEIITNGRIQKIAINNGYLYAVNEDAGMQVYDVNIADFPVYKNTQVIPFNASGIFVTNTRAFVTSTGGHLSIIDITDKSKLPIVGSYNSGTSFFEPFVDGNIAYVPQGSTGVQVLDISKLPTPEWQFNLFGRKNSHQVVASNFYVWVADDKSVEGFYNDAPKSYYFAGNFKFKDKVNRIAVVDGKYIYVCTKDKYLKILKISYRY
ncbi:MAG: LVIVD repeat protein [Chlorobi bacterium OLB5]|nr:MAG: LVIVD repeat protein [Chlorobi bacterium OLB5]